MSGTPNDGRSTPSDADAPLVSTKLGRVRGRRSDEVSSFLAVPYAQPPVGELRFAAPVPVSPWEGVREPVEQSATAPQGSPVFTPLDISPIVGTGWRRGDDYLTLNIWTPDSALDTPSASLPVMVWIHGGASVYGSKDAAVYDGTSFARSGIVVVAINYRLGVEGFLPIPGAPTNLGLRDMIAALQWVNENIGAFGGDPGNITAMGESAGGISTSHLVASPLAAGLFRRAIVQSGNPSLVFHRETAQKTVARIARILKVSPDLAGFRSVSAEAAVGAMTKASTPWRLDLRDPAMKNPLGGFFIMAAVYGDDVLPRHPLDLIAEGAGADVELLIGTNADEFNFWFAATPLRFLPAALIRRLFRRATPDARVIFDAYRNANPLLTPGMAWAATLTDFAFRWPARKLALAHRGVTHLYEFDWKSSAADGRLGAAHGMDIAFTFDTLDVVTGPKGMAGDSAPQELADALHHLVAQFAADGTVPWAPYEIRSRMVHRLTERTTASEPLPLLATFDPFRPTTPGG